VAENKFKKFSEAYDILDGPAKNSEYDNRGGARDFRSVRGRGPVGPLNMDPPNNWANPYIMDRGLARGDF
jgi:DnaJ-class molecular chaperone